MKAKALVPTLALAAALLAAPLAEADSRHRSERGGRAPADGYQGHGGNPGSYGYGHRPGYGYRNGHGSYGYGYRPGRSYYGYGYRPYYRSRRYNAPPPVYNGYGYGGDAYGGYYDDYGYGYYPPPPPPPRYYRPRVGVGIWFGF